MAKRVVIDPITRIEGHLRVDVEVDRGHVQDAWASCTMWRGLEKVVLGRDPREAWLIVQRFCGVCTTVHAMASVRAVEDALGLLVPRNAQLIRNIILIGHALHDHIVHFYHLSALDWVDVTQVPKADPAKAAALAQSLSDWPRNSVTEMREVQRKITGLLDSGQLGLFAHGYWGHPEMRLSPEANLMAVAHYLQALEYQRKANQVVGMLGGKTPHIQNLAVGGVQNAINPDSMGALNLDRVQRMKSLLDEVRSFVHQVYFPDVCAIAGLYPDWLEKGQGASTFLSVPDLPTDLRSSELELMGGVIEDMELSKVRPIENWSDPILRESVSEDVTHAWYSADGAQHPWEGTTEPAPGAFEPDGKYTWVKAPRYQGKVTEVGPLASVLVGYARNEARTVKWSKEMLGRIRSLSRREVGPTALRSTLGRHGARAIRAAMLADLANEHWQALADNVASGDGHVYNPPSFPKGEIRGVGFHEAPRGTLSHWVVIRDGKIVNYQAVVPTTWNASPRDERGQMGPYEAAIKGLPVADAEAPLEVLRAVHAFDPCMACACHTFDAEGQALSTVKVL